MIDERLKALQASIEADRTCGKSRKDEFIWDGLEHGLGVKFTPAGTVTFIFLKTFRRRPLTIKIGNYGDITLEQARKEARRLNGLLASGRDPVAEAKESRKAAERQRSLEKTVRELWERYEAEVLVDNKPRTAAEKRRMWTRRIEPAIGKLKVKDVTDTDVSEIVRAPQWSDKDGKPRGRGEAGNLYRLLNHMFSCALRWKMRSRELGNPLEAVKEPKVERRTRLLNSAEVAGLWNELDRSLAATTERRHIFAAIKLLFLTGARVSEILTLRWDEVDDDSMELHLQNTKTGRSDRPISGEALSLIRSVKRVVGVPYVFRSATKPKASLSYSTVEGAFQELTARAAIKNCTLHTLRHWFATQTANRVNNPRVGMRLTGHKSLAAYMNYLQVEKGQAQELAQEISEMTINLDKGPTNVIELPDAKSIKARLARQRA